MNRDTRKMRNIPNFWILILALIGLIHKTLETFGWLESGSWLNFILLLIAPIIWVIVIRRKTNHPFTALLMTGGVYGILAGIIEVVYWINYEAPLGLGDSNWSFADLLTAIEYYLTPGVRFISQVLFGLFLGAVAGLAARMINNWRST